MASVAASPWDVTLSPEKRDEFTRWLCDEILNAEAARSTPKNTREYWWKLYEQDLTRGKSAPWPDAADLTSYLGTEKVDALEARIVRTVFVDPVWTVEGWGESARKAAFVEDFHQWQVEAESLQPMLSRWVKQSLVEERGVLEVYEDTTERVVRREVQARVRVGDDGVSPVLDAHFEPVPEVDEQGRIVEVTDDDGSLPTARMVIDEPQRVRSGPGYRIIANDRFLVLPGHAREKADIFGYAKMFTKRVDQLTEAVKSGLYDKRAVEAMTESPDYPSDTTVSGAPVNVANQDGPTAEKELWEVQLLHNLDGKGLRWYIATVHVGQQVLLRLKHDDVGMGRFILGVPFPRTDRSHEGYSFIGHKLITTIEEHTAWRNMLADRAALEISAPVKRLTGALWDPDLQPFGPKAVIDVRDMKEIEAFQLPPAMNGAINREQEIVQASERVAGINDVALGQTPENSRTLGEVSMVAEQSFVRMDEVIKNLQEALEELGQVRHAIWIKTLRERGAAGLNAPADLMAGVDSKGGDVVQDDTRQVITADMLEGTFRFKPRGSTDTADKGKQRGDYMQFLQSLGIMFQTWPAMAQMVGQNSEAAKSALEQGLRLFNIPDKQSWVGNEQQWQMMAQPPLQPGMPPGGGPNPGAPPPPGMPPEMAQAIGQAMQRGGQ